MRLFTVLLAALLVLIQYPMWLGKGGWFRVVDLERSLVAQRVVNDRLRQRNAGLEGEVVDLKQGLLAVEERARYELGLVRSDEVFVQVTRSVTTPVPAAPVTPKSAVPSTAGASSPPIIAVVSTPELASH